jgi:hypothetical protein
MNLEWSILSTLLRRGGATFLATNQLIQLMKFELSTIPGSTAGVDTGQVGPNDWARRRCGLDRVGDSREPVRSGNPWVDELHAASRPGRVTCVGRWRQPARSARARGGRRLSGQPDTSGNPDST